MSEQKNSSKPAMREVAGGIMIDHERPDDGTIKQVSARMNGDRLHLSIGGSEVLLTFGETGYFLAQMATWYEQGE